MTRRLLSLAALCIPVTMGACEPKGPPQPPPSPSIPTVNLFGYEETQIHWMHYNIQSKGRVFLAKFDPKNPAEMELLDCALTSRWEYRDANAKHVEQMSVHDQGELRARVPLGVARFSSYVSAGSELEFNYVTVGAYQLVDEPRVPRDDPACSEATHYVASLSVGAVRFDEKKSIDAGADVKVPGGAGGGGSASHREGATRSWGDVEACKDNASSDPACRTPMQMMLIPLGERYWVGGDSETTTGPNPDPTPQPEPVSEPVVGSKIVLNVDKDKWSPGYYMAMSLSKLLSFAAYVMEQTKYGLDGDAVALMGGYLKAGKPLLVGRPLTAGQEYVFFGASARNEDIDIYVADAEGNILAKDTHDDSQPVLYFTPPTTGNYQLALNVNGDGVETFGSMGIAVDKGFQVPADMMQKVFQNLLDKGVKASDIFAQNDFGGASFLDSAGDWAMQATILNPGNAITQGGVQVPANRASLFLGVGHDMSMNLDLEVTRADGNKGTDTKPDGEPVVLLDPSDKEETYSVKLTLTEGKEATLGASLILRDSRD